MAVYVGDMAARYGRMIMFHMISDSTEDDELHAMAATIGISRKWHQKAGTPHSHYDICQAKRALAVKAGAIEITRAELGALLKQKRLNSEQKGPTKGK